MRRFELCIKRIFDVCASFAAIVLLTLIPVLIVIPIAIRLTSRGPALFIQERTGKDGKIFKIYKFRTMRLPEDSLGENGKMIEPEKRITKVGAILRKTSLDELMQLFNVLNGTMSFVGPRPTLPEQADRYTDEQKKRLDMRPGVTGWAQVNGRNNINWMQKITYDIEYIEKFSLWFDIKILFRTVFAVLKQDGIKFRKGDVNLGKKEEVTVGAEKQ